MSDGRQSRSRRQREARKWWVDRKAWAWSMSADTEEMCWQILVRERSRIRSERRPVKALYTGEEFIQGLRYVVGEPERNWGRRAWDILAILAIVNVFAVDYVDGTTVGARIVFIVLAGLVAMMLGRRIICLFVDTAPHWAILLWNAALIVVGCLAGSELWPVVGKAVFGG